MYLKIKRSNVFTILTSLAVTASISVSTGFASGLNTELPIELNNNSFQQIIEDSKVSTVELNEKLSKLEEVNKPLLTKYENAKDKFDKANEELTRLKVEKSTLEQQHKALTQEKLKKVIKKESSKVEIGEMEKISKRIKDLDIQIEKQEVRCEVAKSQCDQANKKYQESNETINSVRTKIEEAQKRADQAEKDRDTAAKLLEQKQIEKEAQIKAEQEVQDRALEAEIAVPENILAKEELTEQGEKNDSVNQQNISTIGEERVQKLRQIDQLKVAISECEKRVTELQIRCGGLVARCNEMQTKKDEVDKLYQGLLAEFRLANDANDAVKVNQIAKDASEPRRKSAYYADVMNFDKKTIQTTEDLIAEASQMLENLHKLLEKAQEELEQINKVSLQ